MIEQLTEFLSTNQRRIIFWSYMFGNKSQSEIVESLGDKTSVSTIDRITQILKYLKIIKKVKVEENKQYYSVDWDVWTSESFKILGFYDVDAEIIKKISNLMKEPGIISLHFYVTHPDLMKFFFENDKTFKEFFKMMKGDISDKMLMTYLIQKGSNPSEYPLSLIMRGSPLKMFLSAALGKKTLDPEDSSGKKLMEILLRIYEENKDLGLLEIKEIAKNMDKIKKGLKKIEFEGKRLFELKMKKEVEKEGDQNGEL